MRIDLCAEMRAPAVLANALRAALIRRGTPPAEIRGIATDSREVRTGDLFVASKGRITDGVCFLQDALMRGAAALLVPEGIVLPQGDFWQMETANTDKALIAAAGERRNSSGARVIAISGSSGKTTVKEAVAAVLSVDSTVRKNEGNYNSTTGMPLSLLGMEEADYFVSEIGINHLDEMEPLSRALRPHVALLINIGSAHIGNFGTNAALASEKAKIAAGQSKKDMLLADESIPKALFSACGPKIIHVGIGPDADVRATNVVMNEKGTRADIGNGERIITDLTWPIPGRIGLSTMLFSVAVGILEQKSADTIRMGLAEAKSAMPRMQSILVGERLLLNDTYNASPEAAMAAVETACLLAAGRPVAFVFGDMLELGVHAAALHRRVGEYAASQGIKWLFAYGNSAAYAADGACAAGMSSKAVFRFSEGEEAALMQSIAACVSEHAVLLFKASRKMALDRVLNAVRRIL